jgi:phage tail sheath gpL-like
LSAAVVAISLLTAFVALTTSAMASGKGGGGGGAVAQVKVNSGNSNLDKAVNKFYNCISKTHQDPPTIDQVYNCYYQSLGGSGSISSTSNYGLTGTGTGTTTSTGSTNHHHKHGTSTTTTSSSDVITGTAAAPVLPTSLTFNS